MADYTFHIGGPKNGQGIAEWIHDVDQRQREFKSQISKEARGIANEVVAAAKMDAVIKQQPAVWKSMKADFFKGKPSINFGGKKIVIRRTKGGKKRPVMAGEIAAGAEFGSKGGKHSGHMTRHKNFFERSFVHHNKHGSVKQFPPRTRRLGRGNEGYFFYPNVRAKYQKALDAYEASLSKIFK